MPSASASPLHGYSTIAMTHFDHPVLKGWVLVGGCRCLCAFPGWPVWSILPWIKRLCPVFSRACRPPAAALMVLAAVVIYHRSLESFPQQAFFWGYFTVGLMLFSALLMNLYPVRYIHMGRAMSRNPWIGRSMAVILISCAFTPYLGQAGLIFMMVYLASPLVTRRIDPSHAAREGRSS